MIQNNSAHEPISIAISDDALAQLMTSLERSNKRSSNNSYLHIIQTLNTLLAFKSAANSGDCQYQSTRITLESDRSDCLVELETNVIVDEGWMAHISIQDKSFVESGLTKADLQALKEGDFCLAVEPPIPIENLTVDGLLKLMDKFKIGRPSSYAQIIQDVTSSLVDIENDSVRLTLLGLKCAKHLAEYAPDEFDPLFSLGFSQDMSSISEGKLAPMEVMERYLSLVADAETIASFKENAWRSLRDIRIEVY